MSFYIEGTAIRTWHRVSALRSRFADVSLTPWRELPMLTAPTAGQLANVPIAVTLQDYAVGFVAVQVQEQLQWNGANNMMEKVQQGAACFVADGIFPGNLLQPLVPLVAVVAVSPSATAYHTRGNL